MEESEAQLTQAIQYLREAHQVQEAVILSTCNRVEVYAVANSMRSNDAAAKMLVDFLSHYHRISIESLKKWTYLHQNLEAIRHLFRVTASLDSMVVGEVPNFGTGQSGLRCLTRSRRRTNNTQFAVHEGFQCRQTYPIGNDHHYRCCLY